MPLLPISVKRRKTHPNEKPVITMGPDSRVLEVQHPQFYSDSPAAEYNFCILPSLLRVRTYKNISRLDVEQWIWASQQEGPEVIVLAAEPLSNIAPVREILEATKGTEICHPVYQDFDPALDPDPYKQENYDLTFTAVEDCSHEDCALCRRDLELLDEPELIIIGKSRFDPEVLEATKRYRQRRKAKAKHLKLMRLAMQTMALTNATFETLDAGDEGDEEIRAAALKELEDEVEGAE